MPASVNDTIQIGRRAPSLCLPDQNNNTHRLIDYRGKWVVLYFYPKDNTSGCTKEACQFRQRHARFLGRGAVVLGVSPDDTKSHADFATSYCLPFPLLADVHHKACAAYGVWQSKSMYGRKYMGVVRTTYLIDQKGKVAYRWDKVKVNGHDCEVLATIDNHRDD